MPDFETFHTLVGQASFGDSCDQTSGGVGVTVGLDPTADHDDELAAAVTGTLFRRGVSSQGGSEGELCLRNAVPSSAGPLSCRGSPSVHVPGEKYFCTPLAV